MPPLEIVANLSMLFCEVPFEARIAAAAEHGFDGVECWFPYAIPAQRTATLLREAGVPLRMINTPPGDPALGGRGLAALPGHEAAFRDGLEQALDYAGATGAGFVHAMSGIVPAGTAYAECHAALLRNLEYALPRAAAAGVTLLIEAINPVSTPGYFLASLAAASAIARSFADPALGLLYDDFHAAMLGERLAPEDVALVRHVQLAAAPRRSEPEHVGETVAALHAAGYRGWISGEYTPARTTAAGLAWLAEARRAAQPHPRPI